MTDDCSFVATRMHDVTTDIGKIEQSMRPRQVEVDAEDEAEVRRKMRRYPDEIRKATLIHLANHAARELRPATRGNSRYRWVMGYIRRVHGIAVSYEDVAFHLR